MSRARWISLAGFVGVCLGVGGLGALSTTSEVAGWYQTIDKPSWTPPDSVFGPVWTVLYVLMGVAAWLVWCTSGFYAARTAWTLFTLQLVLNGAWSFIFFGLHQPAWAFIELLCLWVVIALTIAVFFNHRPAAGWLLLPYLAWVTFAAVLNFSIWTLNA